jgi:hypothetical protein
MLADSDIALMTFEDDHIAEAAKRLEYCRLLAERQNAVTRPTSALGAVTNAATSAVSSVGRLVSGMFFSSDKKSKKQKDGTAESPQPELDRYNSEIRCDLIRAESLLLIALIQLVQENMFSFIKAGLNMRRGKFTYKIAVNPVVINREDMGYV